MFSSKNKKILVIIPAYNEARTIPAIIKSLKDRYSDFSILVVNDGSTDSTAKEALGCGAHVISLPFNLGIGGAVQTGFKYAQAKGYDIAIQFDADGQHDPDYIKDILEPVISGRFDMCIGSRFISREGAFKSSFLRRIGIRFFSLLISFLTGHESTDPTSGFRAFGEKIIALFAEKYPIDFPEPESIVMAKRINAAITEVPVIMHSRQAGNSSIRYLKSSYYMVKVTLAIVLRILRKGNK